MAKFQLKIIIIRLLTKKTQDTQADLQISPTLFRLIVACLIVVLLCILPHRFIRDEDRRLLRLIFVFGGRISLRWLRAAPDFKTILLCLVSFPPPPNSWLLCLPVDPRPLDLPLNRFECVSDGLFHSSPLLSTSCAEELLEPPIGSSSCCREGCFISPTAKLTASTATEARGDICDGVGWLLWPSPDDSEAIGHDFGGRSVGLALLREK